MILEHYTPHPLVFDTKRAYINTRHDKPAGFWVSVRGEDDWPSWCRGEGFREDYLSYCSVVTLEDYANILILGNVDEIRAFAKEFGNPPPGWRLGPGYYIDWESVQKKYDGIIITPYQWSIRLDSEFSWYYGWDVASGCIWNLDAIKTITGSAVTSGEVAGAISAG